MNAGRLCGWIRLALVLGGSGPLSPGQAATPGPAAHEAGARVATAALEWPTIETLRRTVFLADHNTRVVLLGVTALGAAGGLVGTFLLLRKRSLLSDTVSHCTLPGIAIAFLVGEAAGFSERSLPWLLVGAGLSAGLGMVAVAAIRASGRVKDDAALAIVLSVFFGLGIALLVIVQQLPTGNAAGLSRFIYGKTAALTTSDARWIAYGSLTIAFVCLALFKEFRLLCFDADFARAQGWPILALDLALMSLVVAVTVVGLQAVGLLLVVALLIIPAAAARFWSHRLDHTVVLATLIGGLSGLLGAAASAVFARWPAGAVIVLAALALFAVSFVFGTRRGLGVRWLERRRIAAQVARQHLLRACYEWCETQVPRLHPHAAQPLDRPIPFQALRQSNHWGPHRMRDLRRVGLRTGLLEPGTDPACGRLTPYGRIEARRVTRNHRLWETYLLRYADVAPQHIHHNADQIEHVLDPAILDELEEVLAARGEGVLVPQDPETAGRHTPGEAPR